jgi:myo-inositol-1(or 4)-monophosphatase
VEPSLAFISELAAEAGELIQGFVGKNLDIQHKGRTDLVTRADHASEEYLIGRIREVFPEHAINAEEAGELAGTPEHQWYIDPLDGTLNYAHGLPIYSISIGYACRGSMELGVVYDPTRDECFGAQRGRGATLNGSPIRVSQYEDLIDCILVTGFPNNIWGSPSDNTTNFIQFSKMTQAVRRLGSAALDVAYIAAGRVDGFWEVTVNQWDVAAGGLIVREAGGVVTDLFGESDFLRKPVSLIAANPVIHSKMLEVIREVRERK